MPFPAEPKLLVRDARKDDLPQVARLAAQLVRQHHALDPKRFMTFEPIEPGYERFLRGEMHEAETVLLVAERTEDGAPRGPVGYAYGRVEPKSYQELLESCGKLHDLFVDPSARGQGVATALVNEIVRRFQDRGIDKVVLLTASQNHHAQRLFGSLGFRPTMIEMTKEIVD
jgi:ribosomal protein S18 acetylase RimI-like enzyme